MSNCINHNSEIIKELVDKMPGETLTSTATLVELWQDDNQKSIEEYPQAAELLEYSMNIRNTNLKYDYGIPDNINKTQLNKLYLSYDTPSIVEDRVNLIYRQFKHKVNKEERRLLSDLNTRIAESTTTEVSIDLQEELRSFNGMKVIKHMTPDTIFSSIKKMYEDYVNTDTRDRVSALTERILKDANLTEEDAILEAGKIDNYRYIEYNKIIDNFDILAEEASRLLAFTDGIILQYNGTSISNTDISILNTDDSKPLNSDPITDATEQYVKDKWMVENRETSSMSSLTKEVKELLSNIPKLDKDGYVELDDLGYDKYLSPEVAYNTLQNNVYKMTSPNDFRQALDKAATTHTWVEQVIDAINDNPRLESKLYQSLRKNFTSYWVQIRDSKNESKVKTIQLNNIESFSSILNSWSNIINSGTLLSKSTIYNKDRTINVENAISNLLTVQQLQTAQKQLKDEFLQNDSHHTQLYNLLSSIGVNINPHMINELESKLPGSISTILEQLNIINNGTSILESGKVVDLPTTFNSVYKSIATLFSKISEDAVESSARDNGKSYYSFTKPSYIETLISNLKNNNNKPEQEYKEFMDREYTQFDWFYKNNIHLNGWIDKLYNNKKFRNMLDHKVLLSSNKVDYTKWDDTNTIITLYNEYNYDPNNHTAWYHVPILSDAPSAEFIKFEKITDTTERGPDGSFLTYKEAILDKMCLLAIQEYNRIQLVKKRGDIIKSNSVQIKPIKYFDISYDTKGDIIDNGGSEFKFITELNYDGVLSKMEEIAQGNDRITMNNYLKGVLLPILNDGFNNILIEWETEGVFEENNNGKLRYFKDNLDITKSKLEEYYWNSIYSTAMITQILTTDLAYYKDIDDFQKRFKEVHAPGDKLYTKSKYGRDIERTIILNDEYLVSSIIKDLDTFLSKGVEDNTISKEERSYILSKFNNINGTDAQAYRSLSSYRSIMDMAGSWTSKDEEAYDRIVNDKGSIEDLYTLWQPKKPFVYTQLAKDSQFDSMLKVPFQNKNAEFLLLAAHKVIMGPQYSNSKLRAINEFMEENTIDVVQFSTTVKVGLHGTIDINNLNSIEEIKQHLKDAVTKDNIENPDVIHNVPYIDYSIQVGSPEHYRDTDQIIGSQIKKLIVSDLSPTSTFNINDTKYTSSELIKYYNDILVHKYIKGFNNVSNSFKDIKNFAKIIQDQIKGDPRYGRDLLTSVSLDENGEFLIPIYEAIQDNRTQQLVNSIIKSKIIKQKTKGGSVVQVSNFGFTDDLKIKFKNDNINQGIEYLECYLPWYSKKYLDVLIDHDTNALDVNKLPDDLRTLIGYRVPTEGKHSMMPLKIMGFLPPTTGGVIILPVEVTVITGCDFDFDKLYLMIPEFQYNPIEYDIKKAFKDFHKEFPEYSFKGIADYKYGNNLLKAIFNENISTIDESEIENFRSEDFNKWFEPIKEDYLIKNAYLSKVKYDNSTPKNEWSSKMLNNALLDVMQSILINPDSTAKILNPSNFDEQKKSARIISILKSSNSRGDLLDRLQQDKNLQNTDKITNIFNYLTNLDYKTIDKLANTYSKKVIPLSPMTFVTLHSRNMNGANLVGVAAVHNSAHALVQFTDLSIKDDMSYVFDNKSLTSLHEVVNPNNPTSFISKEISSYLAAFVDNGKDPVADDLGINLNTANITMLLARSGYSPMSIGVLLNQPILKQALYDMSRTKSKNIKEAIDNVILKYSESSKHSKEYYNTQFNTYKSPSSELALNIIDYNNIDNLSATDREKYFTNQILVGKLLIKMDKVAESLNALTIATRQDSDGGAAGPTIADTMLNNYRVTEIFKKDKPESYPLENVDLITLVDDNLPTSEYLNIINSSKVPFLQAAYLYGIRAVESLLSPYYSQYSQSHKHILNTLLDISTTNNIPSKLLNKAFDHFKVYYTSQSSFFGIEESDDMNISSVDKRRLFIKEYPRMLLNIINNNPDIANLGFIKALKVKQLNKNTRDVVIALDNTSKLTPNMKNSFTKDWAFLLNMDDPTATKLAINLFRYSTYRNGFGYSPVGFMHLAPVEVKLAIPGYIDNLKKMKGDNNKYDDFISQFIYNNLDNKTLVPQTYNKEIIKYLNNIIPAGESNYVHLNPNEFTKELLDFVTINSKTSKFRPYFSVNYGKGIKYYRLIQPTFDNPVYIEIKPLGSPNMYIEYEFGVDAEYVESINNYEYDINDILDVDIMDEDTMDQDVNIDLSTPTEIVLNSTENYTNKSKDTLNESNQDTIEVLDSYSYEDTYIDNDGNPIC